MKGNAQLSNSHLLEICQVCVFVDAAGLYFLFDSFKFIKFKFNKFYVTFFKKFNLLFKFINLNWGHVCAFKK